MNEKIKLPRTLVSVGMLPLLAIAACGEQATLPDKPKVSIADLIDIYTNPLHLGQNPSDPLDTFEASYSTPYGTVNFHFSSAVLQRAEDITMACDPTNSLIVSVPNIANDGTVVYELKDTITEPVICADGLVTQADNIETNPDLLFQP